MAKTARRAKKAPGQRVAILIPSADMLHADFCLSLADLVQYTIVKHEGRLDAISCVNFRCSILTMSRNRLAQEAVSRGFTHTLWIDSDMKFPADSLLRLSRHDLPLVGINAISRTPPHKYTAQQEDRVPIVTEKESTGLEKAHRIGFGMLWVDCEVYKKLDHPWFHFDWLPERNTTLGEDYYFMRKAREAGFEPWVDHDLSKEVAHVGLIDLFPQMKVSEKKAE